MSGMRFDFFERVGHEGEQPVRLNCFDLTPPKGNAEGEWTLAHLCWETVMLFCHSAEPRASCDLPVDLFTNIESH